MWTKEKNNDRQHEDNRHNEKHKNEGYRGHGGYRSQGHSNDNYGLGRMRCFVCYREEHLSPNCPWKDKTNLKLCTKCGVKEYSLEDFLVMLEKIVIKKNINHFFWSS